MSTVEGPDFICIGGARSGTRWLFDQLDHHPSFWMPPVKELHYFDLTPRKRRKTERQLRRLERQDLGNRNQKRREKHHRELDPSDRAFVEALLGLYSRPLDFAGYRGLFSPKDRRLSGDVTPTYAALSQPVIEAISANLPQTRMLYFARDPVALFWSLYAMYLRKKQWRPAADWEGLSSYVDLVKGLLRPSAIVSSWQKAVPDGRFAWFLFDDLQSDAVNFRARILSFLGADAAQSSGDLAADFNRKSSDPKPVVPPDFHERLVARLAPELLACAAELGGAAAQWPRKYGL